MELLPVFAPPHKEVVGEPGPPVRLEMCRMAAGAAGERIGVCEAEVTRGGSSFTVDTLRELDADDPGTELTFIVGGDMALTLPAWREPAEILKLARLGIVERGSAGRAQIEQALGLLAGVRIDFFTMPRIDISSTDIRARAAARRSVRHLVPGPVADVIAARGLYR